jgi:amidase
MLEELGHRVEIARPPEVEVGATNIWVAAGSLFAWYLAYWSRRTGITIQESQVEPVTWGLAEVGRSLTAVQLVDYLTERDRFARAVGGWWADGFDLLLTPTISLPPPRLGTCVPGPGNTIEQFQPIVEAVVRFTSQFNATGQPAISLPLWWTSDNLPVGVQLVSAYGREDVLIRVGSQLEQACPWVDRAAPVHA